MDDVSLSAADLDVVAIVSAALVSVLQSWIIAAAAGGVVGLVWALVRGRSRRASERREAAAAAEVTPGEGSADHLAEDTDADGGSGSPTLMTGDVSCTRCGTPLRGMRSRDVVGMELDFQDEYRDEVFCSQAHAAAWLTEPLPPLPPRVRYSGPSEGEPDWALRALVAAVIGILGLALYGAVSLVILLVW